MKQVIGFATQFYTLWNYEAVAQYKTDSYGNHHQCGVDHKYYYIKNISTDLFKVQSLHPSIEIDMELRGEKSFVRNEKFDLPGEYFWGGKYAGKLVNEIMESDFKYCLWSAQNYGGNTAKYITEHPKFIAHFASIEAEKQDLIHSASLLKIGEVVEITFQRNGYNANEDHTECWSDATFGELDIVVCCPGAKPVSGMYPYLMPIINGKAQKTKGKTIPVKVIESIQVQVYDGVVRQIIRVA
ncbi:MAG TPA: hypothetical protein PL108_12980 [Sediminibacterium sp.]|nr:hypothetical protein [Sediminibacterium sp.]